MSAEPFPASAYWRTMGQTIQSRGTITSLAAKVLKNERDREEQEKFRRRRKREAMRIHLARSSEPLQRGRVIESLCTRGIVNAELVSLDAENLEPRTLGGICPKCFVIAQSEGRTYEAGIVSGEEMKQKASSE